MAYSCLNAGFILSLLIFPVFRVNGQISTPCTNSMISSFTPCFNYLTGSSSSGTGTGTGSSPTAECCDSLKNVMSDSMDCTCLIVTGNVPVSIPFINRTLAISLPRMCKNSVPLQCKATGVTLPSPGPALFAPTQAPIAHAPHAPHAHSPKASKATAVAAAPAPPPAETPLDITPAAPPEVSLTPTANPGIRPVLTPNSASNTSIVSLSSLLLLLIGTMVLKFF